MERNIIFFYVSNEIAENFNDMVRQYLVLKSWQSINDLTTGFDPS